jgi:hypothetical protein
LSCIAVYDATVVQTVLQKAGISCPNFTMSFQRWYAMIAKT